MVARFEEDDFNEDVHLVVDPVGTAALLPRSAKRLDGEQMRVVKELQLLGHQWALLERDTDAIAADARELGISWSLIGFCLGITGEAARKRYRDEDS